MEYRVYPLYKKTHVICSPPQRLGSPAQVAPTTNIEQWILSEFLTLIFNII